MRIVLFFLIIGCSVSRKNTPCSVYKDIEAIQKENLKEFFNIKKEADLDSIVKHSAFFNLDSFDAINNKVQKEYEAAGNLILSDSIDSVERKKNR